jgi:hypothetical protein
MLAYHPGSLAVKPDGLVSRLWSFPAQAFPAKPFSCQTFFLPSLFPAKPFSCQAFSRASANIRPRELLCGQAINFARETAINIAK